MIVNIFILFYAVWGKKEKKINLPNYKTTNAYKATGDRYEPSCMQGLETLVFYAKLSFSISWKKQSYLIEQSVFLPKSI